MRASDTLNRVDVMKQESPANVTATTWSAKIQSTKAVDIGYFADGAIQTISRTQGADVYESLPLLTTYDAIANGLKHEGKLVSVTHSGFATNGVSPGNRVYSYEYGDQGRIEYMTPPAGQRKYGYDSFDQEEGIQVPRTPQCFKTADNVRIIVPNSTITSGTIRNLSAEPQRRIDLVIGTSYHDDLRAVRQLLEEVVNSDARILADPAPVVAVSELGDSSVNFVVRPWVLSANYNAVKFHLMEQIKLSFDARGLTIPFPSRDVFVHHSMAQNTLPFVSDQSSVAA